MFKYLLFAVFAVSTLSASATALLPTPKKLEMNGSFSLSDSSFKVVNNWGKEISGAQLKLFADTLSKRLGWKFSEKGFQIVLKKTAVSPRGEEFYTLDISPDGICISAGSAAGLARGLARLQALTLTRHIRIEKNKIILPRLSIKDYPDNKERIFQVNLRQVYAHTPKAQMLETAFELIDRAD